MHGQHSKQSSFFDMIYDLIPADHLLRKLAAAVDFSFVSELVSDCYCPDNGWGDVQDRLLPNVVDGERVVNNIVKLVRSSQL